MEPPQERRQDPEVVLWTSKMPVSPAHIAGLSQLQRVRLVMVNRTR